MQHLQNNDLRKVPNEKGKGLVGAAIIHLGLLVLLLIVAFSAPDPPEQEDGIIVNFGTDDSGIGMIEPSPSSAAEEPSAAQPVASENPSQDDPLVTQNFDKEAPEIKKTDPEAEKKRLEQIEAERKRQAELEAERVRKAQEEAERRRIEEEQKRVNDIMSRTANALSNARNTNTTSAGEGITGGQGNQGVTTGTIDSQNRGDGGGTGDKGISYTLEGRNFKSLPEPKYEIQDGGKVVVEIIVDRLGKVTQATPGVKGSTTLNEELLKAAREAALKALFDPKPDAPMVQKGTITYNFILK